MVVFLDYEVWGVAQAKQKSSSWDGQALEQRRLEETAMEAMLRQGNGWERKKGEKAAEARGRVALLKFCAVLFESNFCLV